MLRRPEIYLTWSTIKMWSRDRASLFWTFFLPLVIMVIFGLLNFGELGKVDLGIVDNAGNEASAQLVDGLAELDALRISAGDEGAERAALADGRRDLVVILPADFGEPGGAVVALYHLGRASESQVGLGIMRSAIA